ncbi:hypothetical protein BS47DRAFT_1388757 [Hydnum rufescens UP504]|uniref:Uncharacterized protein n=1 Tax=Hydnum rufescens UP504 TaxID=1448309 RepID=A0A9P6B8B8_9AGAM|nr:hypothetical protein BS47DRAFT_1388757 [Hydnum rufescens UP504]
MAPHLLLQHGYHGIRSRNISLACIRNSTVATQDQYDDHLDPGHVPWVSLDSFFGDIDGVTGTRVSFRGPARHRVLPAGPASGHAIVVPSRRTIVPRASGFLRKQACLDSSNITDGPAAMVIDPSAVDLQLSLEGEETLQHRRLEVDERNVQKISKKLQTYVIVLRNYQERAMTRMQETSGVHPLDELRRALEVESGAFLLVMQKSSLVVQPEIMQAQEYGLTKE